MQDALNSLYNILKNPQSIFPINRIIDELVGPDLIWVSPSYKKANPRVAVIGQQQLGWEYTYRNFIDNWTIEDAVSVYKEFNFAEKYPSSPFWQFFGEIRNNFFGGKEVERGIVTWLNLIKFVTTKGEPILWQPFEDEAFALQDCILNAELDILKPDICIFVTGPNYDRFIKRYYPGVVFQDLGLDERVLCRLLHKSLPERSFRTYHPKALRFQNNWDIVIENLFRLS